VVVGKNTFKTLVNKNLLSTTTPNPSSIRRGNKKGKMCRKGSSRGETWILLVYERTESR